MANATVQTQGIRNAVRWSSGANAVLGVWLFSRLSFSAIQA